MVRYIVVMYRHYFNALTHNIYAGDTDLQYINKKCNMLVTHMHACTHAHMHTHTYTHLHIWFTILIYLKKSILVQNGQIYAYIFLIGAKAAPSDCGCIQLVTVRYIVVMY
jgi:hypothetical protein